MQGKGGTASWERRKCRGRHAVCSKEFVHSVAAVPPLSFRFSWKLSHEPNVLVEMSHLLAVDMCFLWNLHAAGEEFCWWENTFHSPSGPQDPVKLRKRPLASSQQIFSLQIYPVYKQKAEVEAIRELGKRRCPMAHHINHIFTVHAYLGKRSKLIYKGSFPS